MHFFIVTSIRRWRFFCSIGRIRCWSAVNRLGMLGWPFCSASYCLSLRQITVFPISMLWLT